MLILAISEQYALLYFRLLEKFFKSKTQLTQFLWQIDIEASKLLSWAAAEAREKILTGELDYFRIHNFDSKESYFSHQKRYQNPVPSSRNLVKKYLTSTMGSKYFYVNLH